MRRRRGTVLSAVVAAVTLAVLLSGCRAAGPLADPRAGGAPGQVASGIALAVDGGATCTPSDEEQLCSFGVWYVNTTDSDRQIDATKLLVRDSAGAYRAGTADSAASALAVRAHTRELVRWTAALPVDLQPVGVVWTAADGSTVSADVLGAAAPSGSPTGRSPSTATPTR